MLSEKRNKWINRDFIFLEGYSLQETVHDSGNGPTPTHMQAALSGLSGFEEQGTVNLVGNSRVVAQEKRGRKYHQSIYACMTVMNNQSHKKNKMVDIFLSCKCPVSQSVK